MRVLITEGGSRQTLPIAKALRKMGCEVTTLNNSKLDLGNVSKYPTKKIIDCCENTNCEGTKSAIEKILRSEKYDLVIPMSDFTATLLAENKEYFSKYAEIAVNDWSVFTKASDKLQTMEICMANNIPCPKTFLDVKSINDLKGIEYPVVIKPRSACGSIGFNVVENEKQLEQILNNKEHDLGPMFVQEYIPQTDKQFNVHMFLDKNHDVKTMLVTEKCRWFPVDGGASTLSRTVHRPDIVEYCTKLLKEMKWVGYCDVDLILDPRDNIPKIIEINARISANVKICYLVGFDIAKQILENYFEKKVTKYGSYKKDIRLRCIHTDILWLIKSPNRFKTDPSWWSFKNTSDQIFAWDDIIPIFAFSLQSLEKYKKEMKKRKRY